MSHPKHNKIIFAGPVGAGKTTAIQTISDVPVIHTEEMASDDVKAMKQKTTVAMDYGAIVMDPNNKIHVYGTPGQKRFKFMWDILSQGSVGLVLLIDATSPEAAKDLRYFIKHFGPFIDDTAVAIGITKTDVPGAARLTTLRQAIAAGQRHFPLFAVDAREKADITALIESLLYTLNPCFKQVSGGH